MKGPIRVLHVVTHMNMGGLETMIMNYYRNIDRTKVQFDFLTHRSKEAAYDKEIKSLGGNIFNLPVLNPFSLNYRKKLRQFFKEHKEYKIIHVHQDCLSSIIVKEAKKLGVPVRVSHSHSSSQDKNLKYLIKLYYKRFIKKYSTHLFACGKDAGEWMFGTNDFTILNNAIDASKYIYDENKKRIIKKEMNISENSKVIGHVGRFSTVKNHAFLIDIFEKVLEKEDCYLLLVGDGELKSEIEEKVKSKNLQDRVIFTGVRSDVADLMQAMDVFVFPSLYEGLPLVLVEAQAAGIPCVISENIPDDCELTDLIKKVALDCSKNVWTNAIISSMKIDKINTYEKIKEKDFDIKEKSRKLQEFYLIQQKKEEQ